MLDFIMQFAEGFVFLVKLLELAKFNCMKSFARPFTMMFVGDWSNFVQAQVGLGKSVWKSRQDWSSLCTGVGGHEFL